MKRKICAILMAAAMITNTAATALAAETVTTTATNTNTATITEFNAATPAPSTFEDIYREDTIYHDDTISNEALFEAYVQRVLYDQNEGATTYSSYNNASKLTGVTASLYNKVEPQILQIADGTLNNTVVTIDLDEAEQAQLTLTRAQYGASLTQNGAIASGASEALSAVLSQQFDFNLFTDTLLSDHPLDLYWYKKSKPGGTKMSYSIRYSSSGGVERIYIPRISFSFYVAAGFQDEGAAQPQYATTVDIAKINAAKQTAQNIVNAAASMDDYGKLCFYKNSICDMVSYENNHATLNDYSVWQPIYVFDGDPDTNVVCEGYAKAFQYLCDLTEFTGDTVCYSVNGDTGVENAAEAPAGHMWNIVHINGNNYLVDVTNCDGTNIGAPDKLFMAGGTLAGTYGASTPAIYRVSVGSRNVLYTYDSDMIGLYTPEELTLSATRYLPTGPDASASIKNWNIGLTDKIFVKIEAALDGTVTGDDFMSIFYNDHESRIYVSDTTVNASGNHVFIIPLTSKDMAKDFDIQMNVAGQPGSRRTISVKLYADTLLTGTTLDTEGKNLVKSMLNYGAYAQMFFDDTITDLANDGLFAGANPIETADFSDLESYTHNVTAATTGLTLRSTSLVLDSDIDARVYFDLDDGAAVSDYTFVLTESTTPGSYVASAKTLEFGTKNGRNYVYVPHIMVTEMDKTFHLAITNNTTEETTELDFGAFHYAKDTLTAGDNDKLTNLVKSMVLYNRAAKALEN